MIHFSRVFVAFTCLFWSVANAELNETGVSETLVVFEGDTGIDMYYNGLPVPVDQMQQLLWMNGQREHRTASSTVQAARIPGNTEAGDVFALKASNRKKPIITMKVPGSHVPMTLPALGGLIASVSDGTMTNSLWRCQVDAQDGWNARDFDDSSWPLAEEQDVNCCPWRDENRAWQAMNAKWIWAANRAANSSISYCRYKKTAKFEKEPMDGSAENASASSAPILNIMSVNVGTSFTRVLFTVSEEADVACDIVDSRFELRAPTALELRQAAGGDLLRAKASAYQWTDTGQNLQQQFVLDAIVWHNTDTPQECQQLCQFTFKPERCTFVSFYDRGGRWNPGNCKLMNNVEDSDINSTVDAGLTMLHSFLTEAKTENSLGLSAMLLPGLEYHTYCAAFSVKSGLHSSWAAVKASKNVLKTKGCFDCGLTAFPAITLYGGWASIDSINVLASLDKAGKVYCVSRVPSTTEPLPTAEEIRDSKTGGNTGISMGGTNGIVTLTGLAPGFSYEVICAAYDLDGQESPPEEIKKHRRIWETGKTIVPIIVQNVKKDVASSQLRLTSTVRLSDPGTLFCLALRSSEVKGAGVPNTGRIIESGLGVRVFQAFENKDLVILGLNPRDEYETYCTATAMKEEDNRMEQELQTPYPEVTIEQGEAGYSEIKLTIRTDRKANVTCKAFAWQMVPIMLRPLPPSDREEVASGPSNVILNFAGLAGVLLDNLDSGTFYDVFCYAEDITQPGQVFKYKMDLGAVLETRSQYSTLGPRMNSKNWMCIAGTQCSIGGISGSNLTNRDRVLVRNYNRPCRASCHCTGVEDGLRKGAFCSAVSQDPLVQAVPKGRDEDLQARDPRGAWCYVTPGKCSDEQISVEFPDLALSYHVCEDELDPDILAELDGFPDFGLSKFGEGKGTTFSWNGTLLVAGGPYHICWCDGATSSCTEGLHFHLPLGLLHISGPTKEQQARQMSCISGMPCGVKHFSGHALSNGARLLAIPDTPLSCSWMPATGQTPGAVGFPNEGITGPAALGGTQYFWRVERIVAPGGRNRLCWCGDFGCDKRVQGVSFLLPAGTLDMIGPHFNAEKICYFALPCILPNVSGQGLDGGDRVMILDSCGVPAQAPLGWIETSELELSTEWTSTVGWIVQGPQPEAPKIYQASINFSSGVFGRQGVFGFPNHGISVRTTLPGLYSWDLPTMAAVGKYRLCWCSMYSQCEHPSDFLVSFGDLEVQGPLVHPGAAQSRVCVGARACEIYNIQGVLYPGDRLLIAEKTCGGPAAKGVPNQGMSLYSLDGHTYSWGTTPVYALGGEYTLCWCSRKMTCTFPEHYAIFAGVLRLKRVVAGTSNFEPALLGLPLASYMTEVPDYLEMSVALALGVDPDRVIVLNKDVLNEKFSKTKDIDNRLVELTVICAVLDESLAFVERWPKLLREEPLVALASSDFNQSTAVLRVPHSLPPKRFFCSLGEPCVASGIRGISLNGDDKAKVMSTCGAGESPAGFSNNGVAKTWPDGRGFAWESVPKFAGYFRVCWCAAEAFCMGGSDFADDIGQLVIGGPLPDTSYDCYYAVPCLIDPMQDSGAIKKGDRLRVSPKDQKCGAQATGVYGFPQSSISSPAKGGTNSKAFSWGSSPVWAPPGSYRLCWCSAENFNGDCDGDPAKFDAPGGMLRIGTEREYYMAVIYPTLEKGDQTSESVLLFLILPLPFICCGYIFYTFWKGSGRPKLKLRLGPDGSVTTGDIQKIAVKAAQAQLPASTVDPLAARAGPQGATGAELQQWREAAREITEEEEQRDVRDVESNIDLFAIEDLGTTAKNKPSLRELPSTSWSIQEAWTQPAPLVAVRAPPQNHDATQVTATTTNNKRLSVQSAIVEAKPALRHSPQRAVPRAPLAPLAPPPALSPQGADCRILQVMDL